MTAYYLRFELTRVMNEAGECLRATAATLTDPNVRDGSVALHANALAPKLPLWTSSGGHFTIRIDPGEEGARTDAWNNDLVSGHVDYAGPQGGFRIQWQHQVRSFAPPIDRYRPPEHAPAAVRLQGFPPIRGHLRGDGVDRVGQWTDSVDQLMVELAWAGQLDLRLTRKRLVHWFLVNRSGHVLTLETFDKQGAGPEATNDEPAPTAIIAPSVTSPGTWRSDFAGAPDRFAGKAVYAFDLASSKHQVTIEWKRSGKGQPATVRATGGGRLRIVREGDAGGEGDVFRVYRQSLAFAAPNGTNVIDSRSVRALRQKIIDTLVTELEAWTAHETESVAEREDYAEQGGKVTKEGAWHKLRLKYVANSDLDLMTEHRHCAAGQAPIFIRDANDKLVLVTAGFPNWCGIFGVWVAKAAGAPGAPRWVTSPFQGPQSTSGDVPGVLYVSGRVDLLHPGDIGYTGGGAQHHVVATKIVAPLGTGTTKVIEGNADNDISPRTRVTKRGSTAKVLSFYCTAPAPECIDDAWKEGNGRWNCPLSNGKPGTCPVGYGPDAFTDSRFPADDPKAPGAP